MRTKKDRGNRDNSIRKSHYFAPKIPLFGGHLVDYVRESGQPIPRVVSSCIRTINLHGFCHQVHFKSDFKGFIVISGNISSSWTTDRYGKASNSL